MWIPGYSLDVPKHMDWKQLKSFLESYHALSKRPLWLPFGCRALEDAIQWGSAVQRELLHLSWPEPLLRWQECAEAVCPESGELLWRGLRVCIGMAYGLPTSKAPLNTGGAGQWGGTGWIAGKKGRNEAGCSS